ncbi:MAG: DUF2500 domain-containing protein [Oscillospiraceae bacterium]|nr:DUF2500 domain-containing protein [Oscillospiraceae bacterium]
MMPFLILAAIAAVFLILYRGYEFYTQSQSQNGLAVTAKAKLLRKESHVSTRVGADGAMTSDEVCNLVFALDEGGELTFSVSRKVYGNIPENEWGALTYQGPRFIGFEFKAGENG